MDKLTQNTEDKILNAAEEVFIERGMDGARMQTIADRAGINKSLLHYYYRSKSKLFQFVFKRVALSFIPDIIKIFDSPDLDFFTKLRKIVFFYIDLIQSKPQIPNFILHELSSNPEGLVEFAESFNFNIEPVFATINEEIKAGRIREIDPAQLVVNVISLSVFPLAAKPIIKKVLLNDDEGVYNKMIEKRKSEVADFVINAIKI